MYNRKKTLFFSKYFIYFSMWANFSKFARAERKYQCPV